MVTTGEGAAANGIQWMEARDAARNVLQCPEESPGQRIIDPTSQQCRARETPPSAVAQLEGAESGSKGRVPSPKAHSLSSPHVFQNPHPRPLPCPPDNGVQTSAFLQTPTMAPIFTEV